MDQIDRANELAQLERDYNLQQRQQKTVRQSLTHCIDCEEPIPENRRKLQGVTRCIDCQTIYEQQQKQYRK
ncbi:TraR/DksA C4-type zinc finger protein [Gallibacterium melopsittaci]|uniref:TraR/DksA C4-type zinc finger protein n=1 Tax=Gallibacterium melopsittaci TaxID=516063 RepID=A0ABV6HVU6_9PAST